MGNPKIVKSDTRGQLVIPKELRKKLKIKQNQGFFLYEISSDTLVLKKIKKSKLNKSTLKKLK